MGSVETKIKQLPDEMQKEVEDFVDFLLHKKGAKKKKTPKLDWVGGLRKYRNQYTALELQKKALEWRD